MLDNWKQRFVICKENRTSFEWRYGRHSGADPSDSTISTGWGHGCDTCWHIGLWTQCVTLMVGQTTASKALTRSSFWLKIINDRDRRVMHWNPFWYNKRRSLCLTRSLTLCISEYYSMKKLSIDSTKPYSLHFPRSLCHDCFRNKHFHQFLCQFDMIQDLGLSIHLCAQRPHNSLRIQCISKWPPNPSKLIRISHFSRDQSLNLSNISVSISESSNC